MDTLTPPPSCWRDFWMISEFELINETMSISWSTLSLLLGRKNNHYLSWLLVACLLINCYVDDLHSGCTRQLASALAVLISPNLNFQMTSHNVDQFIEFYVKATIWNNSRNILLLSLIWLKTEECLLALHFINKLHFSLLKTKSLLSFLPPFEQLTNETILLSTTVLLDFGYIHF